MPTGLRLGQSEKARRPSERREPPLTKLFSAATALSLRGRGELVPLFQSQLNLQQMPVSLASHAPCLFSTQRLKQRERDIYRLIVLCFRARNVSRQCANCTTRRRQQKFFTSQVQGRVVSRQRTHRHRLDVSFDAGNLSGKEKV